MTLRFITHNVKNTSWGISGRIHWCMVGQQCAYAMSSEIKLQWDCTTQWRILPEACQMHYLFDFELILLLLFFQISTSACSIRGVIQFKKWERAMFPVHMSLIVPWEAFFWSLIVSHTMVLVKGTSVFLKLGFVRRKFSLHIPNCLYVQHKLAVALNVFYFLDSMFLIVLSGLIGFPIQWNIKVSQTSSVIHIYRWVVNLLTQPDLNILQPNIHIYT